MYMYNNICRQIHNFHNFKMNKVLRLVLVKVHTRPQIVVDDRL